MSGRRKPTSTRQKKADQQLKRAIKRGDAPPPEPKPQNRRRKPAKRGPTGRQIGDPDAAASHAAVVEATRRLQSAFIKLPTQYVEHTKFLASTTPLLRPIPEHKAVFHPFIKDGDASDGDKTLTCPKRPKWRFDMSKTEVEHNEEAIFKKWLSETDQKVEKWQQEDRDSESEPTLNSNPNHSPSYFERNIEVWRQLWRVTEISDIILVLLDSRCPTLHYPPSLERYLADRNLKVILVLTKVDITGPTRVAAWIEFLKSRHPSVPIVQVESYLERSSADQQGKKLFEPSIPDQFRANLVQTIRDVHADLLEPPERIRSRPKALEHWTPRVKRSIDWDEVLQARGERVGMAVGGAAVPRPESTEQSDEDGKSLDGTTRKEPEFLTIGLIGQPNVGKSSLLNALFGATRVRASKTPGKTKHFQTLFWTPEVRLVDCPGLVMPNYVLSGILPISRISAVPACILFASQIIPLERIYNLAHPSTKSPPAEDKRTWRDGMKSSQPTTDTDSTPPKWTAMDILAAYAELKGWLTAKAGRPDVHRAGNAMLRALAEGRVGWAFWPPGTPGVNIRASNNQTQGIWIPRGDTVDDSEQSEDEKLAANHDRDTSDDEEDPLGEGTADETDGSDPEEELPMPTSTGGGRFGALSIPEHIDGPESDDDESES